MKPQTWKIIAIVFIILFVLQTAYICYGVWEYNRYTDKTYECYYDVCELYPEALLSADYVCTCYDYDNLGYTTVAKEVYLG